MLRTIMRFTIFDRLIMLTPFVIPLLASLAVAVGIIPAGPIFSRTFTVVFSIFLVCGVAIILWRIVSLESQRALPQGSSTIIDEARHARARGIMLFVSSFLGTLFSMIILGVFHIRNILGTFFFVTGLLALLIGLPYKDSSKTQRTLKEGSPQERQPEESLAVMYEGYLSRRNLVLITQATMGVVALVAYFFLGVDKYLSFWDLIGFLFFLGSFCIWYVALGNRIRKLIETSAMIWFVTTVLQIAVGLFPSMAQAAIAPTDKSGQPICTRSSSQQLFNYDGTGNVRSITAPALDTTRFTYDPRRK